MTTLARLRALTSTYWDEATITEVREVFGAAAELVDIALAVRAYVYSNDEDRMAEFDAMAAALARLEADA